MVGNTLQTSLLDQIFANNDCVIGDVNLIAPLGKSDHACIEIEANFRSNIEFINIKQRNWSKVTAEFVVEKGNTLIGVIVVMPM